MHTLSRRLAALHTCCGVPCRASPRGRPIRQCPDRRNQRRLLPARRRARQQYRQGHAGGEDVRPGDQGLGRESEPAAGRPRRDRVHAGRFVVRRLEGERGRRVQDAAEEIARHRRDLSQLHPDRRARRFGHQDARRPEGQEVSVGAPKSGTELNARTIFAAAGLSLQGLLEGRIPALRRKRSS